MRRILLLTLVSLSASSLLAQNAPTSQPARERAAGRPASIRQVSLEEAITMADRSSETLDIARSVVTRARGQQLVARSQFLPQLDANVAYARTLASQFEGFSFGGPDTSTFRSLCTPNLPSSATPAERQAALDQAQTCQAAGGGVDFSSVGFGARNQWTLGLQFSQPVFTGGRNLGTRAAANASRRAADIELTAQRAQLILDVTEAYYNAVLASRLADIAQTTLALSDEVLRQTTRMRQVGSAAEFDLLRAQVARDNQLPVVLRRRSEATIATYRLKQMLELPLDDSLELTTPIDDAPVPTVAGVSAERAAAPDTSAASRSTVREASENVKAQEGLLLAARSARFPTISITSGYQRLFFPINTFPELNDFRENWTIGVSAGVSLFSGGRVSGQVLTAQANLREARAREKQARELAALDARIAVSQLEQAEASWRASQGTAEQARRAYTIDQVRYREGISTQTDLTQSQLLVEQAMVNRAVAARDLAVARMRLALLKDLPLTPPGAGAGTGTDMGAGATGAPGAASQPAPQPPRTTTTSASSTSGSFQQ
jgi:outer membrane protein